MKFSEYLEEQENMIIEVKAGKFLDLPDTDVVPIGLGMFYYEVPAGRGKEPQKVFLNKQKKPIAMYADGKTYIKKTMDKKKDIKAEIEQYTGSKYYRIVKDIK